MSVTVSVRCLQCGAFMKPFRQVAHVIHHYSPNEMKCNLVLYRCETSDCGNEVIVEDQ